MVITTLKCLSKVNRASRNIRRCFWWGVCVVMLLLNLKERWKIVLVFLLRTTSWACLGWSSFSIEKSIGWFDTNHYLVHLQKCQHCESPKMKMYHLETIFHLMIGHQLDRWYKPNKKEDPKLIPKIFLR